MSVQQLITINSPALKSKGECTISYLKAISRSHLPNLLRKYKYMEYGVITKLFFLATRLNAMMLAGWWLSKKCGKVPDPHPRTLYSSGNLQCHPSSDGAPTFTLVLICLRIGSHPRWAQNWCISAKAAHVVIRLLQCALTEAGTAETTGLFHIQDVCTSTGTTREQKRTIYHYEYWLLTIWDDSYSRSLWPIPLHSWLQHPPPSRQWSELVHI